MHELSRLDGRDDLPAEYSLGHLVGDKDADVGEADWNRQGAPGNQVKWQRMKMKVWCVMNKGLENW